MDLARFQAAGTPFLNRVLAPTVGFDFHNFLVKLHLTVHYDVDIVSHPTGITQMEGSPERVRVITVQGKAKSFIGLFVLSLFLGLLVEGCGPSHHGGGSGGGNNPPPPVGLAVSNSSLPLGAPNQAYSVQLTATGSTGTVTWSIQSGGLPPVLTLSPSGLISGTPTTTSISQLTFQVGDSSGAVAQKSLTLTIDSSITTSTSVPGGTVGTVYSTTITVSGGIAPYTFAMSTQAGFNALPSGLTLNTSTGAITGTPTTKGTTTFIVNVTDAAGNSAGTPPLTLSIG